MNEQEYTAGFDGSAIPNPGEMSIGGWIKDSKGHVIFSFTRYIGKGTNNIAEYSALLTLLNEAKKRNIKKIKIIGDSALVINQVNGKWRAKDPRMKQYKDRVLCRLKKMEWTLEHVVRKFNSQADSLSR